MTRRLLLAGYYPFTIVPPFGCKIWPVMYEESNVSTSSGEKVDGINGVQIGPGATPFTRILLSASACESERVKAVIAPFVEE